MSTQCNCVCEKENKVNTLLTQYKDNPSGLIVVMAGIQEIHGYLPKDLLVKTAEELGVPLSDVYGVATFYASFSLNPTGRNCVNLCMGTACYVKGANEIQSRLEKEMGIKAGNTTEDRRFSLGLVRCLGACGIAPVVTVNGEVYPRMTAEKVNEILDKYE